MVARPEDFWRVQKQMRPLRRLVLVATSLFATHLQERISVAAPKNAPPTTRKVPPKATPRDLWPGEARLAWQEFRELLPAPASAQNSLIRALSLQNGARLRPNFPANSLLSWLDERAKGAATATQKREVIHDFLLISRFLLRDAAAGQQRRGLRAALAASRLCEDDIVLKSQITAAFLAPYAGNADLKGAFGVANLLDGLWPRYGRLVALDLQSPSEIAAMQQKAQTSRVEAPTIAVTAQNGLTLPFLELLARVPGPRQGWACYRLARLNAMRDNPAQALFWLNQIPFGDGAGIFRALRPTYEKALAQKEGRALVSNPENQTIIDGRQRAPLPLSGDVARAFAIWRSLLPADFRTAQQKVLADLQKMARDSASNNAPRAAIYEKWATDLSGWGAISTSDTWQERRKVLEEVDSVCGAAGVALTKLDKKSNFDELSAEDKAIYARALEAFAAPHWEIGAPVSWEQGSRWNAMRGFAGAYRRSGQTQKALASYELWTTVSSPGNHTEQAFDDVARLLASQKRFEDAILTLEAIPDDSGMSGGKVWSVPPWRRQWAEIVRQIDEAAVITLREAKTDETKTGDAKN